MFLRLLCLCLLGFSTCLTAQTDSLSFSGTVLDAKTNEPIPYATVACRACVNGGTLTNEAGAFAVWPKGVAAEVSVSHILFEDVSLNFTPAAPVKRILLKPADVSLPTVEVNGSRGQRLVLDAIDRQKSRADRKYEGRVFYRQTSKINGNYNSLLESFVDVGLTSRGTERWETRTGRYAMVRDSGWLRMSNLSRFFRTTGTYTSKVIEDNTVPYPLNTGAHHLYDIAVTKYLTSAQRTVAVVRFTAAADQNRNMIVEGDVYVDTLTREMLRFDLEIAGTGWLGLDEEDSADGTKLEDGNLTMTFRLDPTADGRSRVISSVTARMVMTLYSGKTDSRYVNEYVASQILVEHEATRRFNKHKAEEANDYKRIFAAKYKPRFWRKYPVLKNTPLEARMISDFESNNYFGTARFD